MSMTDEQVVCTLAEREGYGSANAEWFTDCWRDKTGNVFGLPPYLHSRDALAPVMEEMTPRFTCNKIPITRYDKKILRPMRQTGR